MLLGAGTGLLLLNSAYLDREYHLLAGKAMMLIGSVTYTLTAFLNPGVYNPDRAEQPRGNRFCQICQHYTGRQVHHCPTCDICI